jgi:large-conductance mechanosensitive channel
MGFFKEFREFALQGNVVDIFIMLKVMNRILNVRRQQK